MSTLALAADERVSSVSVTDEALSVRLMDGRVISVPLAWYPRLLAATPAERANWQVGGGGYGIHWPDVDEDLSTEGLLRGAPAARGFGVHKQAAGRLVRMPSKKASKKAGGKKATRPPERRVTKSSRNTGQPWLPSDVEALRELARGNTPTRVIGLKLGRSEASVRSKAKAEGVSLMPPNVSPYGTAGKKSAEKSAKKSARGRAKKR